MKFLLLLLLAAPVMACKDGCVEHEGTCACMPAPFKAEPVDAASDEKPSKHPQAAWERGEIKVDMPQNLIATDFALDEEKRKANAEGMKNAGITK